MAMGMTEYKEINLGWDVKPCPFCGKQPKVFEIIDNEECEVRIRFECEECNVRKTENASFYGKQSYEVLPSVTELALQKWNTRMG